MPRSIPAVPPASPDEISCVQPRGPQSARVVATNVDVQAAQGWRLVSHHASPGLWQDVQEIVASASVLH